MPGIACQAQGCTFNTAQQVDEGAAVSDQLMLLRIHTDVVHPPSGRGVDGQGVRQGGGGKPNKIVTPKLEMGIGPDEFSLWKEKWDTYKRSSGITELGAIRDQLTSCCSDEIYRDLFRTLGSSLHTLTEDAMIKEMRRLAVPHHSNLVNIVAMRSVTQERDERVRSCVARIRGLASVCQLSVTCTKTGCGETVSFAEQEILNTLVTALYDEETREEVLSKDPQMNLADTILFIEAREAGKKSAAVLSGVGIASNQVHKTSLPSETDSREDNMAEGHVTCRYCGRVGHGKSPKPEARERKCPAWGQKCSGCDKKGHSKKCCK